MTYALQLILLAVLLYLSGFFSSAETAMTTVNHLRIASLAKEGNRQAKTMMKILDESDKMLSAILIGNNLVNISASSMAATLTMKLFGSGAVSLSTGLLTLLVLIFGEITPKTIAAADCERQSLRYASTIWRLMWLLTPLIKLVNLLSGAILKLHYAGQSAPEDTVTEEDIRSLVDAGRQEGVLEEQEHTFIRNVFDFTDASVRDVMVPRADMVSIDETYTYNEIADVFRQEKLSRLPVYREEKANIIGVINIKDFFFCEDPAHFSLHDILFEPYYTYENKKISELLPEMRDHSIGLTIVLDEYGLATGMVTMEDLLEELVGQIRDEYDTDEDNLIRQIGGNSWLIEGSVNLDDVNDALGLTLSSEEYDSIGGFVIEKLDQLPTEGQSVTTPDGIKLTVRKMERRRIKTILLQRSE